jgi:pimeloyl-ACP methyl ester carboxylesterase
VARCLLLLPGLLDDARLWRHQVGNLAGTMPVVADLTGADSMALLAASALAQAPAERFVLAGLSMGGYVALEMMRQAPQRVEALALLDTTARPDTAEATSARHQLMALAQSDFPAVTRRLMPRLVHPGRLSDEALTTVVTSMADDVGKDAFFRQERAIIDRIDSRPYLGRLDCPVLVLCGREDALTPLEVHEEMAAGIPNASLAVIPHCGHLSTLERPEEVTGEMKAWIDSL